MRPIKSNPEAVIADLEERASRLLATAKSLREVYGLPDAGTDPENVERLESAVTFASAAEGKVRRGDRLPQLGNFLREHGPMTRKEIETKSDIPSGTIATLLLKEEVFEQQEDGKWAVRKDAKF
jgi:hypothetical protein